MKDRVSCSTTPRAASQQINSQQTWVIPYDDFDRGSLARAHHMGRWRGQEIRQTKEGKENRRMTTRDAREGVLDLGNGRKKREDEIP
jgi:hypothetical protein